MAAAGIETRAVVPGPVLFGRDKELIQLCDLIDGIGRRGGALVVRGEAGIGKSVLLEAAARRAHGRGVTVAATTGTPSEAHLAFSGLQRLLRPFLDVLDRLPEPQRRALGSAFGITDGDAPDLFLIGLGALGLLTEGEAKTPVVLVVEDAHWLDRPSAEVLAFVARRLEMEPVILLFGVRDGIPNELDEARLAELRLAGLDDEASRALLAASGTALSNDLKARILVEAAGNPLALVELPIAASGASRAGTLPLTARLEQAFAFRLADLDDETRALLLLAALGDGSAGVPDGDRLLPAAAAGLGTIDSAGFRFRHPLIRSAVEQAATADERQHAHAALAEALADDPDRAVWHRAASAAGPDDEIATALEAAAGRARARGGPDVAVAAMRRAAELTADQALRALRLRRAGRLAFELGRSAECTQLLQDALELGLPPLEAASASFELEVLSSTWSGASTIRRFAVIAEELAKNGDPRSALEALYRVSIRAHWDRLDDGIRRDVAAVARQVGGPVDAPRRLAVLGLADPVHSGREVVDQVKLMSPIGIADPDELYAVGSAAGAVWADNLAIPFLRAAAERYRKAGMLVGLLHALVFEAWANVRGGAVLLALTGAAESARLAEETRHVRFMLAARLVHAIAAAERGDEQTADRLIDEAEAVLVPMGANPLLALVSFARARAALAADRPGEAYHELLRIFDPGDSAYQPFVRGWVLADLVDAAVHGDGDLEVVQGHLREWEEIAAETRAPHLDVQLTYATAILADDTSAEARFRAATETGWPFYTARAQLAYGTWLRRRRRAADARTPLREAAQTFDALGLRRFAERARRELRASGERPRRRAPDAWAALSPQELQIAQLAAEGLSNREIGERLYLSHRTVGTHLYRLFPKLGITSRRQLRDALEP